MTKRMKKRKPAAFVLDDKPAPEKKGRKPATMAPAKVIEDTEDAFAPPAVLDTAKSARREAGLARAFRWGRVLVSAAFGLFTLWASVALAGMIEDLFARSRTLGWAAVALASLAGLAALAIITRELAGLLRLRRITRLHEQAEAALATGDEAAMNHVLASLRGLYSGREDMRWRLQRLAEHEADIMDPAARLDLAEKELLAPLDAEAARIIATTARQVALLTAVVPAAALDIALVAAQNLKMLRRLATLYGGRPGALGGLKLARMVMTHLAFTGGLALTDNLVQQVLGKGLAGRLSARFGEGAVNGILTARIGLAALSLVRPLPHRAVPAPKLSDYAKRLFGKGEKEMQ